MSVLLFAIEPDELEDPADEDLEPVCYRCGETPVMWELHVDPRGHDVAPSFCYLCAPCELALWKWLLRIEADE